MDVLTGTLTLLSNGIPGLVVAGVTMVLMLLALIRKDSGLMVAAALLVIPFAFVKGAWAGFPLFVRLLPLFSLGSAFFIGRNDFIFAWAFSMPAFGYLVYVLFRIVASGV